MPIKEKDRINHLLHALTPASDAGSNGASRAGEPVTEAERLAFAARPALRAVSLSDAASLPTLAAPGLAVSRQPASRVMRPDQPFNSTGMIIKDRGDDVPLQKQHWLREPWVIEKVPHLIIEPVETLGEPRREGDFLLWKDGKERILFALAVPRLRHVLLTVQRRSKVITGGSVTLTVSAYDGVGPQAQERFAVQWTRAMQLSATAPEADRARRLSDTGGIAVAPHIAEPADRRLADVRVPVRWQPSYQPLVLRGLSASLDIDAALVSGPALVTASPDTGIATFVLPLSVLGTQAWHDALSQGRPDLLAGVCQLTAHYYANEGARLKVKDILLAEPLGRLLNGVGPDAMQTLDAQEATDTRVIVAGHQTLHAVSIDWRPSEGQMPQALQFGPDGGTFSSVITSANLSGVTIDWSAQVLFEPPQWPVIRQSGKLSFANNDLSLVINPLSWVKEYSIFVVWLDAQGKPVPQAESLASLSHRVQCEVRFTAPFLEGGAAIASTFETASQNLNKVAFPLPPGEAPGETKLTVFAQRDQATGLKAKLLAPSDTFILVTVKADAQIEFTVNAAESGSSLASELRDFASQLA